MSYYIVSNELYHHGILGQKWGELVQLEDAVTRLAIEESFGELYSLYDNKKG